MELNIFSEYRDKSLVFIDEKKRRKRNELSQCYKVERNFAETV